MPFSIVVFHLVERVIPWGPTRQSLVRQNFPAHQ